VRIVGLGAICDLGPHALDDPSEHNFDICEFALLDNGERVILHADRGYHGWTSAGNIWAHQTVERIAQNVLMTVLPDDDDTEDEHPWEWLAELAQAQGIRVTADDLREVPYEVVLTERVIRQLSMSASDAEEDEFKRNLSRWAASQLPVFRVADWDGTWSLAGSVRTGSIGRDGTNRFLGTMAQDVSHRRPRARGDAITVMSSRPDPQRHFAQLRKMSVRIYESQRHDNDTAADAIELSHQWEQRLHSREFPWAPAVFKVDGVPAEFQILVVGDVWFAFHHDPELDIEILGVLAPFADLRLTQVTDASVR